MLLALPLHSTDKDKLIDETSGEGDSMLGNAKSFSAPLFVGRIFLKQHCVFFTNGPGLESSGS